MKESQYKRGVKERRNLYRNRNSKKKTENKDEIASYDAIQNSGHTTKRKLLSGKYYR